jgi:hypothetical protein
MDGICSVLFVANWLMDAGVSPCLDQVLLATGDLLAEPGHTELTGSI